jgi:D-alanyl-lipoteichoic acid acyltransferase DltB (MBOAT superfamily)
MIASPHAIAVLGVVVFLGYVGGISISRTTGLVRRWVFVLSILGICSVLFIFKYLGFFNNTISTVAGFLHRNYHVQSLNFLLPLGLSFYTFQSLSYLIEIYRGNQKAENHFGIYASYITLFTKIAAGPIERPQNLLSQFYEKQSFTSLKVFGGIKLVIWGVFQKVVIADRLAPFVNQVYQNPVHHLGMDLIMATVLFAFQIYYDFCGYTDIAIGVSQVMGFKLTSNFNRPFYSKSVSEFWRRWHISLSTWLYEYLYVPLAVEMRGWGKRGIISSLILTFLICGLWHGANWTFIVFGLLHGLALSVEVSTRKINKKISSVIPQLVYDSVCILFTFCFVCFSLIFFRANNLWEAIYVVRHVFSGLTLDTIHSVFDPIILNLSAVDFWIAIFSIVFIEILQCIPSGRDRENIFSEQTFYFNCIVFVLLLSGIILFRASLAPQFIYVRF